MDIAHLVAAGLSVNAGESRCKFLLSAIAQHMYALLEVH